VIPVELSDVIYGVFISTKGAKNHHLSSEEEVSRKIVGFPLYNSVQHISNMQSFPDSFLFLHSPYIIIDSFLSTHCKPVPSQMYDEGKGYPKRITK